MKHSRLQLNNPKTKIICTLGPSTNSTKIITKLIQSGMSIARLNMSHGSLESHENLIKKIREISDKLNTPIAIMIDIPGPKYRIGKLEEKQYTLKKNNTITLTSENLVGNDTIVSVQPNGIHNDIKINTSILIDDGLIKLKAIKIDGNNILCKILNNGQISEKKGVTIPGKPTSLIFPDERSIECLQFADKQNPDFIALSNITSAKDILKAKSLIKKTKNPCHIISKIERVEAVKNIDQIITVSDAVMVARGDLGVEMPIAEVPIIQKKIISLCNKNGIPVITATQMLESMIHSPTPTRAEVTDVANAIFDGTDAIMLSAETSIGQYPIQSVQVMAKIAKKTESALPYESILRDKSLQIQAKTEDSISYNACWSAYQLKAKLIVAFTESGSTAGRVSRYRPITKILTLTRRKDVQRRLTLRWGIIPIIVNELHSVEDFFSIALEQAILNVGLHPNDLLILIAGLPIGVQGGTNLLRVMKIPHSNEK